MCWLFASKPCIFRIIAPMCYDTKDLPTLGSTDSALSSPCRVHKPLEHHSEPAIVRRQAFRRISGKRHSLGSPPKKKAAILKDRSLFSYSWMRRRYRPCLEGRAN